MKEGFLLEQSYGSSLATTWVEGAPESSFWEGGVKTMGKTIYKVVSYRCEKCALLKTYAPPV